jgi:hypothetical protein
LGCLSSSLGAYKIFTIKSTNAEATSLQIFGITLNQQVLYFQSECWTNNRAKIIAYCFAEKKGFSKFGSYTGNGSTDGTFVYTGFKPAWLLLKEQVVLG